MNNPNGHLDDGDLLRLLDGELDNSAASDAQLHIESCWNCRAHFQDMEAVIGDYIRYQKATDSELPPPPKPWRDLQFPPISAVAKPEAQALFLWAPRRWFNWRWALVPVAAFLAMIAFYRPTKTPEMTAEVLLRRGTRLESPSGSIRIRTRGRALVRSAVLRGRPAEDDGYLRSMFERAHYDWRQPLSARAYIAWRDQLRERKDAVAVHAEEYVISTSTDSSELHRATLTLRARDLRPERERLEFAGETVEIEPVESPTAVPNPPQQVAAAPPAVRSESSPGETLHRLLQVFFVLHRLGADLGDPVEISQHAGDIEISAMGLSGGRQRQLRAAFRDIPSLTLRFDSGAPHGKAAREQSQSVQPGDTVGPTRLEAILGSAQAAEDFTDRALDASDAMMARAHALRALATAFGPAQEAALSADDRNQLTEMRNEHATALTARAAELRAALRLVLGEIPAARGSENIQEPWQFASRKLFTAARQFDDTLNREVAGGGAPNSDFGKLSAALVQLDRAMVALTGR